MNFILLFSLLLLVLLACVTSAGKVCSAATCAFANSAGRPRVGGRGKPKTREKDLLVSPRSKSEREIIKIIESQTGGKFPTAFPHWLVWRGAHLELDGYCEPLRIAVEFSGPLHTSWTPLRESYESYFERLVRDVAKERLCRKNKVSLILVDYSLPRAHWARYVKSRLFDCGFTETRPADYLETIPVKPWRNPHLEAELGLSADMTAAERL